MSFNAGDVVRIGKGKVEYKVEDNEVSQVGEIWITSQNTGKGQWINPDRLTLVTAARNAALSANDEFMLSIDGDGTEPELTDAQIEELDENAPMAPWEIELLAPLHSGPYLLTVDHVTTGHKSYGAACDALILAARTGFKHYAVIDHNGQRKATRLAA